MKPSVVKVVGQRLNAAYSAMVGQAANRLQSSECFTSHRRMLILAFTRTRSVLTAASALGTSRRDDGSSETTAHINDSHLSVHAPSCMERLVNGMRSCRPGELFPLCRIVKSNSVAPLPQAEANCSRRVEASGGRHGAANKLLLLYAGLKLGGGCMDSLIDLVDTSVRASTMDSIPRMGDPLRQLVLTLDISVMARCRCDDHSDKDSSLEVRRPAPVTAASNHRTDESSGGGGRRRSGGGGGESEKKRYQAISPVGRCRACEESSGHRRRCLEVIQLRDLFLVVASETDAAPSPFEGYSSLLLRDLLLLIDSYLASLGEERLQLHMEIIATGTSTKFV